MGTRLFMTVLRLCLFVLVILGVSGVEEVNELSSVCFFQVPHVCFLWGVLQEGNCVLDRGAEEVCIG